MIRIKSEGGIDRRTTPIFVCDVCNEPITNIDSGAAVFRDHGHGEGELHAIMHVHKHPRPCHDLAEAQMVGQSSGKWHELRDHLSDLVAGMGVTIQGIIEREVVWSGQLTPTQHNELQDRIRELGEWLREHVVASPLWD